MKYSLLHYKSHSEKGEAILIIAIIVSILIYAALVFYIGWSGYRGLGMKGNRWFLISYIVILSILATSFILGRFGIGGAIFNVVGSYWLAIFGLLLIILPITHLVMLLLRLTAIHARKIRITATASVLILVTGIMLYGSYLAYTPVVTEYNITVDKEGVEDLKIVMFSDTHFGYLSGVNHAKRLVQEVNKLEPDLIIVPGDLIDDDLSVAKEKGIFDILQGLESKYGVYGSLGNHDTYRGEMQTLIAEMETSGVEILYDETIEVKDSFYLVGRKDKSEGERMATSQLTAELDHDKPIFLLDHQPYEFDEAEKAGIDLLVAGHTHRGQIAPGNLITNALFENDYGYLQKGQLHTIVSSGYGFWGPPIRIGSQSEIVVIHVAFQ